MRKNIRTFLTRNNWIKSIPNTLTVCNSLCGFAAILNTLQVYSRGTNNRYVFSVSACMILGAMLFDALDGFAARILNAGSLKGIQMDSLADMVTFGVAPAVLVAVIAHKYSVTIYGYPIAWGLCAIYLAAVAHRLAKYNVLTMVEKKSSRHFHGLPSPGGAAAICSLVFLSYYGKFNSHHIVVKILPFYAGLLAILMVSNVRYIHLGKWLVNIKRNRIRILIVVLVLVFVCILPAITLVVIINGYVLHGLFKDLFIRYKIIRKG